MRSYQAQTYFLVSFVFTLLFTTTFAQSKNGRFKTDFDFGGSVFTTFLDLKTKGKQFSLNSPKNADLRLAGAKARLGRLLGKTPKKGIIIPIRGTRSKDSLFGETRLPVFGKLSFKGQLKDGLLSGQLFGKDTSAIGTIQGQSSEDKKVNYQELYPKLISTVKDNIYSRKVLQSKEWMQFEKALKKLCNKAHDDIELFFGFNLLAQQLPFTHLNLVISEQVPGLDESAEDSTSSNSTARSVVFEEKNGNTAYLQIKDFSQSQQELAVVLPKIVANPAYKHLIIDLRNNGGGGVGAAFELAKYIVTEDIEVGYFPTNKLNYDGYQADLFRTLPELQPKSTNAFGEELKKTPGVKLIFKKPSNPVFTGKLYVLTNGRTASTCEPIVYVLKNRKKATIIGEKTYGGMLSAAPFVVSGKYLLLLPIGDFYTYDGVRLDKVGVSPDVEVKSEEADEKAMELIHADVH